MTDIDDVKSRINIVDLINARVPLKKAGRNFRALCPFHNEKTPSFMVSPERGSWRCFGCGRGGSAIDFVMEYEHVDFLEALETLAEKAGIKLERHTGDSPEAKIKQAIYQVNHLAAEFYHFLLMTHRLGEKARHYLKSRGVSDKSAKTFMLGYSPNNWDQLYKFLRKKGYDDQVLVKAGLVLRGSGRSPYYDRFRGRIMFTLRDHRSNVVGFAGRSLDPNAKEAKYINTSETPVYIKGNMLYGLDVNKEAIAKSNEAILMEGELDVISSYQEGLTNAVAIKGSALTEAQVNLLRRFCERILFALDSDVAGDAAARRGIEIADRAGLDMKVIILPAGKDPDDLARLSPGLLKKAVKDALPIYDYFLSSAIKRYDISTAFGKKKVSEELLPVIAKIDNAIVAGHYSKKLADSLDTPEATIAEEVRMQKTRSAKGIIKKEIPDTGTKHMNRTENIEAYILSLLLQGDTGELFEEFNEDIRFTDITTPGIRRVMELLKEYIGKNKIFLIKDFTDGIPKELDPIVDEALLRDLSEILADPELFARTWISALRNLKREHIRQQIQGLTKQIKDGLKSDEDIAKVQEEIRSLTLQLSAFEKKI